MQRLLDGTRHLERARGARRLAEQSHQHLPQTALVDARSVDSREAYPGDRMERHELIDERDACTRQARMRPHVFVPRQAEQVGDGLVHRTHRKRLADLSLDQREDLHVRDGAAFRLHGDRDDRFPEIVRYIGFRGHGGRQNEQREQAPDRPPHDHQNVCLTRNSMA